MNFADAIKKIDEDIAEIREHREEWESDFDARLAKIEEEVFPDRVALAAMEILMAETTEAIGGEYDRGVAVPNAQYLAEQSWKIADAMDAERKKRREGKA